MKNSILGVALLGITLMILQSMNICSGAEDPVLKKVCTFITSSKKPDPPFSANIVTAEQKTHRVVIFKSGSDWNNPQSIVWQWNPSESSEIRREDVRWFSHFSDCKPVLGATHLLTIASGGGVALVRLSDKKVLFYACPGGNPHSCALLPDGNIVTASSTGAKLMLYSVPMQFESPEKVKSVTYTLKDAHGVVWDQCNKILWTLGGEELLGFTYNFNKTNPVLTQVFSTPLTPETQGGHDLYSIPGTKKLFVTGVKGIAVFDTVERKLTPFLIYDDIKSISLSPEGFVIVQCPEESWWAESVYYLNNIDKTVILCSNSNSKTKNKSDIAQQKKSTNRSTELKGKSKSKAGTFSGARFYKARWWMPDQMSDF